MDKLLPFLKARLHERSSRIQLLMLVVVALVGGGIVTTDQLDSILTKVLPALAVLAPLSGMLIPDKNHAVASAAEQDEAVKAALDAATQAAEAAAGEKATAVAQRVGSLIDKLGL